MSFYNKNFLKIKSLSKQVRVFSVVASLLGGYALYYSKNSSKPEPNLSTISTLNLENAKFLSRQNGVGNLFQLENCSACSACKNETLNCARPEVQDGDHVTLADIAAPNPNDQDRQSKVNEVLKNSISKSRELCWSKIHESGIPGLVVAVSVDGKLVWKLGFGFADVENKILANPSSIMRIASISKSLTMTVVAKLWEEGKIDLDKSVRDYVPDWPEKHPDITVRQLVSHLSGIRHYEKKKEDVIDNEQKEGSINKTDDATQTAIGSNRKKKEADNGTQKEKKKKENGRHDTEFKEFHLNLKFESVAKALELFKDDQLLSKPGEAFNYTTHGFTLLSAVVESVVGEPFEKHMKRMFKELGLNNTYLDENEPLIYNRSRFYTRDKNHKLVNAPNVDNSYKWAGGGFLSNVTDLVSFGNAMLYSYQAASENGQEIVLNGLESGKSTRLQNISQDGHDAQDVVHTPGPYAMINRAAPRGKKAYLKSETMKALWSPVVKMNPPENLNQHSTYGMGWMVVPPSADYAFCQDQRYVVSHTGGAIGASSVLLILPKGPESDHFENDAKVIKMTNVERQIPEGVVVSMICNIDSVGLSQLALEIAKNFENVKFDSPYRVQKVYLC